LGKGLIGRRFKLKLWLFVVSDPYDLEGMLEGLDFTLDSKRCGESCGINARGFGFLKNVRVASFSVLPG
jgi:hypothetical protein